MIARIWHGKTAAKHYDEYTEFTKRVTIPDYSSTDGNRGMTFLRRVDGEEAHFTLITYWDSIEAIKQFAGDDYEKAKYYPDDQNYLLEFEEKVVHHEIFFEKKV